MTTGTTALIIDDDEGSAGLIAEILSGLCYDTVIASSGAEALGALSSESPGLVVMDLLLPDIGAAELLGELRERIGMIPVLVTSVLDRAQYKRSLGEASGTRFLAKPFSIRALVQALGELSG